MVSSQLKQALHQAALQIRTADALLITAGAGIGIDSGLPDFRGENGFWKAYPALGKLQIDFASIAAPHVFQSNPALAWGFYGHRLNLYRETQPHRGFQILLEMAKPVKHGYFVYTSNVDGQFQKAGFDPLRIVECHGSIHHLQCLRQCKEAIWPAAKEHPVVEEAHCTLISPLPTCPYCGAVARPNILMFNDGNWLEGERPLRTLDCKTWLESARHAVVIEIGAGTQIPSVRHFGQRAGKHLIRINPDKRVQNSSGTIAIHAPALYALGLLHEMWASL